MTARHAAPTQFRLPSRETQTRAALALVAALATVVVGAVPRLNRQVLRRAGLAVLVALVLVLGTLTVSRQPAASVPQPQLVDLVLPSTVDDLGQWCVDHNTTAFKATLTNRARNLLLSCVDLWGAGKTPSPTPSPTPTGSPTPTPSSSASPSPSSTPAPTPTATPSSSPTPAPSPTPTASPSPTTPVPSPTQSPTPSPTPPPTGWPDASNTGVPAGVTLTPYTGPCTITTANTVIDSKTVNCALEIRTSNVLIWRSKVNGTINTPEASPYSFTVEDSEVDGGILQGAVVATTHMTLRRANIHGGALSVYCFAHCDIRDSWLHGQTLPAGADWHLGALRADENDDPHNDADPAHDAGVTDLVAVHNTIACDVAPNSSGGGCSGGVTMYGDFGTINHVTLDANLLVGSPGLSYCLYGGSVSSKPFPNAHDIAVTNNVFTRAPTCGAYGPVSAYDVNAPGNLWSGNVWDTGGSVAPAL